MSKEENKNIFVIQNTELGSHLPLSVYLTDLFRNFDPGNNFLQLIVQSNKENVKFVTHKKINVLEVVSELYTISGNISFSLKAFKILLRQHKKKIIDVIHCLYPNSSLLPAVLYKILRNPKVKIVYDVRSPWIEMMFERGHVKKTVLTRFFVSILYFFEFFLCLWVDSYVFITQGLADYYQSRIGKKSVLTVIPSGVDTKLFTYINSDIRSKKGFSSSDIVLGVVSSLAKVRRLDFVVKAFAQLYKVNNKFKLYFIGDGEERNNLQLLASKLRVNHAVFFEGRVNHVEMPKYISTFNIGICHIPDLFVYQNSFPLKILEYLACGIPVVASDISANKEISNKIKNISLYDFVFNSFSQAVSKTLEQKITNTINNETLKKEYDWNALSRKYIHVYNTIL